MTTGLPGGADYLLWSFEFLAAWPMSMISLAIVANFCFALVRARLNLQVRWRKEYQLILLGFLFVAATLIVGALGAVEPNPVLHPARNSFGQTTIEVLLAAAVVHGAFWIYRMKGLRWLAFAIVCAQLWILIGARFIAGMALTGEWL